MPGSPLHKKQLSTRGPLSPHITPTVTVTSALWTMSEKNVGFLSQLFPPKAKWTSADVPDQTGKTVIVTGGNAGIGRETARVSVYSSRRWHFVDEQRS